MKTQKLLPLLFAICLFLFSAHSMAHAQITFKDIAHPIEDASERGGSYMIAGADGHIFVVSINGSFYKSTDNGNSWEPFETPMSGYEVYGAAGSRDGVLVVSSDLRNPGTNGNTWFSDDNGISWRPLGNLQSGLQVIMPYIWIKPESITIQRVNIFDVETVTTYHTIYDYDGDWTTDLGGEKITPGGTEIFTKTGLGCPPGLSSYYLICDMLVLINTEGDVSYIIIHGFEDEEEESFFFHINSFEIISEEHWVLATNMGLYITEDAGDSWTILDDDTLVNSSSIQKSATGELLLVHSQRLLYSSDGGYNWLPLSTEDNQGRWNRGLVKSSNGYIYAYSSTNYFLRTQNNFTSIDEDVPEIANRVILHPNYPNPFNPATVISFELPESAQTTLEVYDIQGRLVESLISNRLMQQGTHQIEWNSGNRASGLYVYRLASGNEILSGKMTLVK